MLLLEASKKLPQKIDFHITGTDISERALERARSAKYSQLEVQRGLAEPLLVQYFKKDDHDTWTATQELRAHTSFQHFNLKESFSFPQKFHLILCRNVLIYHSVEGKKQILNKIEQAMTPQGFFIMGSGESLLGLSDAFECASLENGVIYRTKQKTTATAA
jgi:chemotaxis protein methyltransferase CheR